ncbi:MAG: ketoacyl-ACP synthase III [Dysgonamonadaceae bacterium]|jgi:3-oxoacyl-[acyl-carrier-protein] synthase-3|nr:ketoacyl-ACP synthase III [Dysgonamonadaceae bacterium]
MAFLEIKNVKIAGISACVPKQIEKVVDYPYFTANEAEKFSASTGVVARRITTTDVITSDMCVIAAERLISNLKWDKSDIDCLVFVTQTPDYILPATSCIIQERLGLSVECYALDISLGCSGWTYGLSVLTSLLSSGAMKKGLLLSGESASLEFNVLDKSAYPLFGDAGTATAIEYKEGADGFKFHFGTDGSGYDAIIIEDGGYRNLFNKSSFEVYTTSDGLRRTRCNTALAGMDVFAFGISRAPESIRKLCEHFLIDLATVDAFVMHQANLFMNEKIREKLKIAEEKTLYSLQNFGNTSSASIPLTLITNKQNKGKILAIGFGVGLSWSSVYFETDKEFIISDLVEI